MVFNMHQITIALTTKLFCLMFV